MIITIDDFFKKEMQGFHATMELFNNRLRVAMSQASRTAEMGGDAPNPKVFDLKKKKVVDLLDFESSGRPLVLNFGSCT